MIPITASMLYDYVSCPHRVAMDLRGNAADRDEVSPFVQLLWERGFVHEQEVISELQLPFLDLSKVKDNEREKRTLEAMKRGEPLIYSGRISAGGLLGIPDLLRKEDGGYIAGDIKSGSGEEGGSDDEDGKPKVHYAVQVALYTDILEQLGLSAGHRAFIWDVHGDEVGYDFSAPYGIRKPRTLWQDYLECLADVRAIVDGAQTLPAYSSACKQAYPALPSITLSFKPGRNCLTVGFG
jgi:predicted RecB family nuclease